MAAEKRATILGVAGAMRVASLLTRVIGGDVGEKNCTSEISLVQMGAGASVIVAKPTFLITEISFIPCASAIGVANRTRTNFQTVTITSEVISGVGMGTKVIPLRDFRRSAGIPTDRLC